MIALEGGGPLRATRRRAIPLMERNPLAFWQVTSALLAIGLITSLLLRH